MWWLGGWNPSLALMTPLYKAYFSRGTIKMYNNSGFYIIVLYSKHSDFWNKRKISVYKLKILFDKCLINSFRPWWGLFIVCIRRLFLRNNCILQYREFFNPHAYVTLNYFNFLFENFRRIMKHFFTMILIIMYLRQLNNVIKR